MEGFDFGIFPRCYKRSMSDIYEGANKIQWLIDALLDRWKDHQKGLLPPPLSN